MPLFNNTYSFDEQKHNPNQCSICGKITYGGLTVGQEKNRFCDMYCYMFNSKNPGEKLKAREKLVPVPEHRPRHSREN